MRQLESWLLSYLLNSLWQIPLLLAMGWLAVRLLKGTGAAVEHRVWVTVLLLQGFLPAFSALPREWLSTLRDRGAHPSGDAHVSVVMGSGTGFGASLPGVVLAAIAIAYAATIGYFAVRFVWNWRRVSALRRQAVILPPGSEAALCCAQYATRLGISGVSVASSSRIFGPVTIGFLRKLILLPADMLSGLSEVDLNAAVAHEFAHLRRNDFLKNLLYELLSLPLSYHPALWFTRERIMESREMVCDQMACEISGPQEYARSLLRLAALLVNPAHARIPHAIGILDANTFERRVMKLTRKQKEIHRVQRMAIVLVCTSLGVGTCASAVALSIHVEAGSTTAGDTAPGRGPVNVAPEVMAGNKISGPIPKYPAAAKKARIQGTVLLDAIIGKDGSVGQLTVTSGPEELQQSALDAVREWKYKPFLLNGAPVEVKTTITVIYTLSK